MLLALLTSEVQFKLALKVVECDAILPLNGVRLMEFDTLLKISLVVERLFFLNTCSIEQLTLHAHHVNIWQSLLASGKYFILFLENPKNSPRLSG